MTSDSNQANNQASNEQPDADFIRAIEQILDGYQRQMNDRISSIETNLRREFSTPQSVKEPTKEKPSVATTALEKQVEDLKQQLNESAIKSSLRDLASEHNVDPKYQSMFVTMLRSKGEIVNDNGDLYLTDSKGQAHTLSDFASSFISSEEGKILVGKQSAPSIPYGSQSQSQSSEVLDPFMALAGLV